MPPNQDKTSNGKHIEQNQRPQLLCVLLVQRIYAIDLAHDATVGERSRNSKFSYVSPRSIYGETSNKGKESASTYPCRSLSGSVQVNGVDGVVLVVIQITDDPSAERTAPPRSTHMRLGRRLLQLDPARGKERLMKIQQHDGVVVEATVISAGLRQASARGRGVTRGKGGAKCKGAAALPPPSLYRDPRGAPALGDGIS